MGAILQKLFGGGGPVVEADTAGSCTSQCCETVMSEVSSSSSEHTHPSRHAASSFGTIPPEIENICESGTSAVAQKVSQTSGRNMDIKR